MIRVLLVDDSPLALAVLKGLLSKAPDIEVVGTAPNGKEALEFIPRVKPDVICSDLHMPVMDGLVFTKCVMAAHPLPILLVSVWGRRESREAFEVLQAGAVDVFLKPSAIPGSDNDIAAKELASKVRILAGVKVFRRTSHARPPTEGGTLADQPSALPEGVPVQAVVIGASTGGPQALEVVLKQLSPRFPVPILCIQHISVGFLQGLIDWLSSQCSLKMETALAGGIPQPGHVYFAPEDTHLKIDALGRFELSAEPPWGGHRPSVSVTMKSVAEHYGKAALGVLLTGMGSDGAEGLLAIRNAGGFTIAQEESTCVVFGMPRAAIRMNAAVQVAGLPAIGAMLWLHVQRQTEKRVRRWPFQN